MATAAKAEEKLHQFAEGDLVRTLDRGKLYNAKIIRVGADNQYFIHYQGWNKKWDRWVHASLLLPEGPEAEKFAAKLADQEKKAAAARESAKRGGANGGDGTEGGVGKAGARKKSRVDVARCLETPDPAAAQIKLPLPFTLKKQLVEDWEAVTQTDPPMLPVLPRETNIDAVVQMYLAVKAKKANAAAQQKHSEIFEGLQLYFDAALPVMLLYANERAQHDEICRAHPGVRASKIYGPEHLLRLFTKLPSILGAANLSPLEASQLQAHLGDFLKYLQKNSPVLFSADYEPFKPAATEVAAADRQEVEG